MRRDKKYVGQGFSLAYLPQAGIKSNPKGLPYKIAQFRFS